MQGTVLTALLLTLFAGLATGLGSLAVLLSRRPSLRVLSFGLGFSGGVMVFVSLAELLPYARELIGGSVGEGRGDWIAYACFFGGILLSRLLDAAVPEPAENPHEVVPVADLELFDREMEGGGPVHGGLNDGQRRSLARVGLLTALAIAIHNVPEGMATFMSAMADPALGVSIAVAVAIHNIPEGISVAVLVFFATRSRTKAFAHSLASGLAEPVGALLVYLALMPFINDAVVGGMLATVAGIMVFISFDELLPMAREYGKGHLEITGVILGMAVMAVSLALL
jgi:ZIP family zinc transporter